jgi:hypothetical protein
MARYCAEMSAIAVEIGERSEPFEVRLIVFIEGISRVGVKTRFATREIADLRAEASLGTPHGIRGQVVGTMNLCPWGPQSSGARIRLRSTVLSKLT